MYLLDTDIYTLYLCGNTNVDFRFKQVKSIGVHISEVTVSELLKGRLATVKNAGLIGGERLVSAYNLLSLQVAALQDINIVPYTLAAEAIYSTYDTKVRRVGTNECRIAATTQTLGFTVVTANARHFDAIGCAHENWSV